VTHLPARRSGKSTHAAVAVRNPRDRETLRLLDLGTPDAREQALVAGESVFRVRGRVAVPQATNENDDASVPEGRDTGGGWHYHARPVNGQQQSLEGIQA
jgi:hypothetical protein